MLKIIFDRFKNMDIRIKQIMKYGFNFSFFVCLIAVSILFTYEFSHIPELYYIGLSVFRLGLFFVIEFIICGLAIDTIKGQMC